MFTAIALICLTAGEPFKECELLNSPSAGPILTFPDKIGCDIALDLLEQMTSDEGVFKDYYIADYHCIKWNPKYPGTPL